MAQREEGYFFPKYLSRSFNDDPPQCTTQQCNFFFPPIKLLRQTESAHPIHLASFKVGQLSVRLSRCCHNIALFCVVMKDAK